MPKFKMVVQEASGALTWDQEFESPSPMMARQSCQKETARWVGIPWFKRMHLLQYIEQNKDTPWFHLKSFTINSPSVKEHDRT